ncbi:MAG: hypothetical protein ACLRX6_03085 [Limosilactobacillus pontis]|uniref:hypothetical protein n=1 Tax=Limosilactobacillus pontis TaxID=35787 RepID=UPI00399F340A
MSLNDKFTNLATAIRNGYAKINQKLSLDDMYMILASGQIGTKPGVNLLNGSDPQANAITQDGQVDEYRLTVASSGNGKGSLIDLDPAKFTAKHGFRITDNTSGSRDFNQRPVFYDGSKYTFSVWSRLTPGTTATKGYCYIRSWSTKQSRELTPHLVFDPTSEWQKFTLTFDTAAWYQDETASFAFGVNGAMSADFAEPMLEVGETAHAWQLSPFDKLGGVINPALTALRRRLRGGVAYAA